MTLLAGQQEENPACRKPVSQQSLKIFLGPAEFVSYFNKKQPKQNFVLRESITVHNANGNYDA